LETDKIIDSCGASNVHQELPVLLAFRSADQVDKKASVVTYIMLLTGSLQFAEKLSAHCKVAATIERLLASGMSARDCAMRITASAIVRVIAETFEERPHQCGFLGEQPFCQLDRDSLREMIHCICDRIQRWRRLGAVNTQSANQLCRQVYDALRSNSESWAYANAPTHDLRVA
jgi:hypothetical protein